MNRHPERDQQSGKDAARQASPKDTAGPELNHGSSTET